MCTIFVASALPASAEGPLVAAAESQSSESDDDESPPPPPLCTTDVRLSGTVFDAVQPERSFALLHVQANRPGEVYREGTAVAGLELESIEPRGVLMRGEHGLCWLNILGTRAAPGKPSTPLRARRVPPRHAANKRTHAFSREELDRGIHAKGEHAFEVERALIQTAVGRVAQLSSTTRLAPVRRFGTVAGMQLQALADDGLLAHLGLARGDLLKSLNGVPLTDLGDMLRAEELLKTTPRLSLLVMRQGVPIALDYRLVN